MSTLWSGRFDAEPDAAAFEFGASFRFDSIPAASIIKDTSIAGMRFLPLEQSVRNLVVERRGHGQG